MRYAYYPGCCDHTSAKEYDISTRAVCKALGIELMEIPDWSCCGSTPGHSTSHLLGIALSARNLALVEEMGLDCTASCAACYQRLAMANVEMKNDTQLCEKINHITGKPYRGGVKVKSILEVIAEMNQSQILAKVVKSLKNLKIAVYYGCLMVRPRDIQIDDPENPTIMDNLLQNLGAQTLEWNYKTECCGAALAMSNEDIVLKLANKILADAKSAGANCIVTACPLCHFNLDMRQKKVNKAYETDYNLPVFYFTQLVGLALGIKPEALCLRDHFIDTKHILKLIV
ncbi:CoB--CoM heterodisulfide reductase [Desulfofarcimen acetoxidans DSM 771]|uniref:CoB--CoM heterodisulfide reductase n=1 Tax=Desulfofarcimen acetoxidans (strain ATCC 49208 / DSM 771 / KCTC 5769 / VKM B-1644 / 5575) TaxID=485916 RepID=C8W6E0_DESAS|nr:CoB--CoM heterodisulfide reductase iron-sulfur subunit B family protein [Desulfofarcimen acetoxidans]ACV62229.1 CoB--CoM heterodisulfide reductase [Desulfofarcimen acetoxidans DSM 771]